MNHNDPRLLMKSNIKRMVSILTDQIFCGHPILMYKSELYFTSQHGFIKTFWYTKLDLKYPTRSFAGIPQEELLNQTPIKIIGLGRISGGRILSGRILTFAGYSVSVFFAGYPADLPDIRYPAGYLIIFNKKKMIFFGVSRFFPGKINLKLLFWTFNHVYQPNFQSRSSFFWHLL